ncbi:helix-turn-helix domain-containing protein [Mycobacterium hubeiense]|uniref:helix-turn-helix domain-containing protein n=1 Tax=Mycobacterium hubeiense TaxID=1867256 RepID=UPI000C7EF8D1|nr:helix-turn-helix domain-containing protein [Mycobacterium sp. QGD 101]
MSRYTRQDRLAAVTPTLSAGAAWLYRVEQPAGALAQPQGVGLPVVADRRFVFVPESQGRGTAVVVYVTTVQRLDGPTGPRDVLTADELDDIAEALATFGGATATIASGPGQTSGRIELASPAHSSLRAAVARYRAGCPVHRLPACGHIRRTADTQCAWFPLGYGQLVMPTIPAPRHDISSGPSGAARRPAPPANSAQLGAANARRRDRGAARTVAAAREAIAVLSRRPHRSTATEEALEILRLRVDHPELSLRELAAMHRPPLTKDSYAARLRRALAVIDPARTASPVNSRTAGGCVRGRVGSVTSGRASDTGITAELPRRTA